MRETDVSGLYRKFRETMQEPVRLEAAVKGYFLQGATCSQREDYGRYLRKRVRAAVEFLMRTEDTEKLDILEEQGYLDGLPLDGLIQTARNQGRTASLVWLLRLKQKRGGYHDRDFSL